MLTGRSHRFLLALALIALSACAGNRPWLNSERIEERYGNYAVEVLRADAIHRVSSLYSVTGGLRTTRTYAVVEFLDTDPAFRDEDRQIRAGASIGETFRSSGWSIRKDNLYIGELEVPQSYGEIGRLMDIQLPATLAVHQYLFVISNDAGSFDYARITEIHHPDYLSVSDLRRRYGEILFDDSNRDRIHDFIGPPP